MNKKLTIKDVIQDYEDITRGKVVPGLGIQRNTEYRQREVNFSDVNHDEVKSRFKKLFNYK